MFSEDSRISKRDLEPCFCSVRGNRVGWFDNGFSRPGMLFCDDCAESDEPDQEDE